LHFQPHHFFRVTMTGQSSINHLTLANPRQYEIMAHFSGWLTRVTLVHEKGLLGTPRQQQGAARHPYYFFHLSYSGDGQ
jgi:hypothetical protein